jgi:hypothetical protein
MADTRINALSTATSSVSDDFVPIDGTTNGTRKLSAFSPSFGGNATVGGTLTVNGGTTLNATLVVSSNVGTIGKSGTGTGGNWRFVSDDGTTRWLSGILGGAGETSFSIYDIANSRSLLTATAAGVVQINQTTASTTTSSGALVVGNGTSGGLGVGGNVTSLGFLLAGNGASKNANTDAGFYSTATGNTTLHVAGFTGGSQSADILKVSLNGISEWLAVKASGQVACYATTASTSTSSGALVVSGGVGVAGDVYAGGTTGFKLGSSSGAYRFSAGAFIDAESSSVVRLLDSSANFATVKTGSLIALTPATAPSLTVNSTMTFELTSNTTLKVFVRGTDGTTRSVSLTLA